MNFFHDASHAVFWVITAVVLSDMGRPVLSVGALALGFLAALYMARNIVRREMILWMRKKKEEDKNVR